MIHKQLPTVPHVPIRDKRQRPVNFPASRVFVSDGHGLPLPVSHRFTERASF